jgi:NADH-quinone oxidoreductase subunit M
VLSGLLIKMGTYGLLLFLYVLVGLKTFVSLRWGIISVQSVLCWLGAITIVIPTFIALLQDDAKRLLAWHSIGQVGYIILGIGFGTGLSIAGGTFHVINHATFKALLFLSVGAVEYRTGGVRDLNSLGGLMKKMPVTFIGALVGAFGIIGIPLTNGFVSKLLIYKTLILNEAPFLAFAALIGTWGTLLSFYKFIHNIFLGQLPEKYKDIKKAPVSMQLPILIYAAVIVLFGILPGIPLTVINIFINSIGLDPLQINLWGIGSGTCVLSTINICMAIIAAAVLAWLVFRFARRSVFLSQEDSYAAGAIIPKDKYHHTVDFYNPLYRMIEPYLKDVIDQFYYWIARCVEMLCDGIRRIYTGDVENYVLYIVLFVALLITAQIWWQPW